MEEKKSKITLKKVDGSWVVTIPWRYLGTLEYNFGSGLRAYEIARRTILDISSRRSELA